MIKVSVLIGSRANYASSKQLLIALNNDKRFDLDITVGASAVLDRFGTVSEIIKNDGLRISAELFMNLEGDALKLMPKTIGVGLLQYPEILDRFKPHFLIAIGDRFETFVSVLSASLMNIPVAHIMGGEVSGTIDESIRHAITKMSHLHFVATKKAEQNVIRMGEDSNFVFHVGCPRIDLAKAVLESKDSASKAQEEVNREGIGDEINLNENFFLVAQHPVTTELDSNLDQITAILRNLDEFQIDTLLLWPNADSGNETISRKIRMWNEKQRDYKVRIIKNLKPETYLHLMNKTLMFIGNSSSAIREGSFIGTPSVLVGTRQSDREFGKNVVFSENEFGDINSKIKIQLNNSTRIKTNLYGDGDTSLRILDILATASPSVQKKLTY